MQSWDRTEYSFVFLTDEMIMTIIFKQHQYNAAIALKLDKVIAEMVLKQAHQTTLI